jgi:hypothetical protein
MGILSHSKLNPPLFYGQTFFWQGTPLRELRMSLKLVLILESGELRSKVTP